MTTDDKIKAIESRCERATPGEWVCTFYDTADAMVSTAIGAKAICFAPMKKPGQKPSDGQFIAHSRSDIPWLLSELKRAREALRDLVTAEECSTSFTRARKEATDNARAYLEEKE